MNESVFVFDSSNAEDSDVKAPMVEPAAHMRQPRNSADSGSDFIDEVVWR